MDEAVSLIIAGDEDLCLLLVVVGEVRVPVLDEAGSGCVLGGSSSLSEASLSSAILLLKAQVFVNLVRIFGLGAMIIHEVNLVS